MWKAAGLMFVAMSLVPAGDTAGKLLTGSHGVSPLFVAWSRFAIGAALIGAFAPPGTLRLFGDWRIWLRGLLLAGGISAILTALRTEPVADVFAAFFVGPLFSYALSAVLAREPVTPLRTALMLAGFAGVLLVVRPGFGAGPGMGFAVLAGLCYGAYLSSSRWLAPLAPPRALLVTQLVTGGLILTPVALPLWPAITPPVAALTLASATASMLGNLLLLTAYAAAPATRLAPFVYFQLLAAVALGWAVFGELPDALTWAGLALVITAGIASARLAAAPLPPRPDRA
ncbi:EamA/RhaT family transporter [Rhodosalinus halophilus]|uniref:EamA/RhaT family transporter n=1 Tax=Rhodosalinus halophilus TaxID=2259333 RepID=A0A365U8H5_9RHOB|nr:DMT family transporter [Rhodosalinus halophilus]RBI84032.1 EamA/RhaT family transporter [Rhodosalinus halophilus]